MSDNGRMRWKTTALKRRGGWKSDDGMATDKQLRWGRGNNGAATNGKQQSTNVEQWMSNNGRMSWRTTVAEETRQMEKQQQCGNYGWWWRGDKGSDNNNNNTAINKCEVAEAEDEDGWQEAGCGGGGRGATVVQRQRKNSFAIRSWRMEVEDGQQGCIIFFFLGGVECYLKSYLNESWTKPRDFGGSIMYNE
jgi:hypothetical protein